MDRGRAPNGIGHLMILNTLWNEYHKASGEVYKAH